jgi:hypothetical protein
VKADESYVSGVPGMRIRKRIDAQVRPEIREPGLADLKG